MKEPIAFLFPAFPNLHQTFVLWEVLALRELGVCIEIFSIKRPITGTQQPEAEALRREVTYLPSPFSPKVWAANLRQFLRRPLTYLGLYAKVAHGWWSDREAGSSWKKKQVSAGAPDHERTLGEEIEAYLNRSPFVYLLKSLMLVPLSAYFGEELRRRGIRRVHSHWASYSTTVALTTHWLFDIPFSFSAHAYDIYMKPHLIGMKVREAEFAVTCAKVNAGFLQQLAGEGQGRVVVNYHGVSLDRFKPVESPRDGIRGDMPTVVTCGRLEPYKGHHVLLRAVARIGRPVRCVIVGEGPQRRRLENLARELGIADRVEFTGPVPQARLAGIYAGTDVFALASVLLEQSGKRDVIPNVLAEAMAMKIAVVASDVSGIRELVENGVSGQLVPPNDVDVLAAVLAELFDDAELRDRLAEAGAEKVRRVFNRRVNIVDLADLFLAENGSASAAEARPDRAAEVAAPAVERLGRTAERRRRILPQGQDFLIVAAAKGL